MTTPETDYAKAFRLLEFIYEYEKTLDNEEPVLIINEAGFVNKEIGLSEKDAKDAWRYLREKNLIKTWNRGIYAARINANGKDAIEKARLHPDEPVKNFPFVTFNSTKNIVNVGTAINSPVQQGGAHANMTQTVSYGPKDLDDLRRLIEVFDKHLDDLALDAPAKQKVMAQVATIKAQLEYEPDPVIVKQAGGILRDITVGTIGSLIATGALNPAVWATVTAIMLKLFGGP